MAVGAPMKRPRARVKTRGSSTPKGTAVARGETAAQSRMERSVAVGCVLLQFVSSTLNLGRRWLPHANAEEHRFRTVAGEALMGESC